MPPVHTPDTHHLELRCAVPPYASKALVLDAGLGVAGTRSLWLHLIALAAADGARLSTWVESVLKARDPMALFLTVAANPAALETVLERAAPASVRERLEGCPLWADTVGPLRTPSSAHGRVAILSRMPSGDALDRFVCIAYPFLVGPSPWANGVGGKPNWTTTETLWREALALPPLPSDKRLRQAIRQAQRGRAKGPVGGEDWRRPDRGTP
jgi:hypothetical protein